MNITDSTPLFEKWFVGRDEYLREFMAWLRGERNYRVLFLQGPGGIGKTWLLRKMITEALDAQIPDLLVVGDLIDMYATANHSVEGVRNGLIELLGVASFEETLHLQSNLETAERDNFPSETIDELRRERRKQFLEDCQQLSRDKKVLVFFDTFERVQGEPVGSWILTELVRELPNFRFVVASRETWSSTVNINLTKLEGFSPDEAELYFKERGRTQEDRKFLDVFFEKSSGHPLRIALATEYLGQDVLQAIDDVRAYTVEQFDRAIMKSMRQLGYGEGVSRESFESQAHYVLPYVAYFNQRFNADILSRIATRPHLVDSEQFTLQSEDDLNKFIGEFQDKLFFVKTRPDGYIQLHDEVEDLAKKYWWPEIDPRGDIQRELAEIACHWYDEQVQKMKAEGIPCEDWKAEQIRYWFDVDPDETLNLLQAYGYVSTMLNNLLITEIKPEQITELPIKYCYHFAIDLGSRAHHVSQLERSQEYWQIAVGAAQNDDEKIDALIGLHNSIYPLDLKQSLKILREDALPLAKHSGKQLARVLYTIGFHFRQMENIPKAIEYYEQAKEKVDNIVLMATILNDMGYAYVFLGDYKRAGRYVKRALDLRSKLVNQINDALTDSRRKLSGKANGTKTNLQQEIERLENELSNARWQLGLSFNTLGQIKRFDGDLAAATGLYSEALEIFSSDGVQDYSWQARALHARGEAHRRIAATLFEQGRLQAAKRYEERAREDLQRSLTLCEQFAVGAMDTACRRMGRLLHDQALRTGKDELEKRPDLLNQARRYFNRGVKVALDTQDMLEEFENLTEIAFLVNDRLEALKLKNGKLTSRAIQDGEKDISLLRKALEKYEESDKKIYQYPVFQHLLELEEGAFYFEQDKYDKALDFYLKGFIGLASERGYGVARYRQHLGHLVAQIERLEEDEARRWVDAFIQKWKETIVVLPDTTKQTLAQLHPELIEEMQIYLDTAFLL